MKSFDLESELSKARSRFETQIEQSAADSLKHIELLVIQYFRNLIDRNYTREQLYKIANGLTQSSTETLTDDWADAIRNYETGLTGLCAVDAIIRIPGDPNEPEQRNELAAYVRNLKWTDDPSIKPVN